MLTIGWRCLLQIQHDENICLSWPQLLADSFAFPCNYPIRGISKARSRGISSIQKKYRGIPGKDLKASQLMTAAPKKLFTRFQGSIQLSNCGGFINSLSSTDSWTHDIILNLRLWVVKSGDCNKDLARNLSITVCNGEHAMRMLPL